MAMSMGTKGGANGGRGRYRPLAEINVTPFVDVMLVLLIIFMVTAPLMTSGVTVDLPKTNAAPLNSDNQPLTVSINAQGQIYLQDEQVEIATIVEKLRAIAQNNPDRRIFVRGDKDLAYGRIMEVMGTITQGGFSKVALLAEQRAGAAAIRPTPPALAPARTAPSTTAPSTTAPSTTAPPPAAPPVSARPGAG
jgi:biopolymer transport protein TolR